MRESRDDLDDSGVLSFQWPLGSNSYTYTALYGRTGYLNRNVPKLMASQQKPYCNPRISFQVQADIHDLWS